MTHYMKNIICSVALAIGRYYVDYIIFDKKV